MYYFQYNIDLMVLEMIHLLNLNNYKMLVLQLLEQKKGLKLILILYIP